MKLLQLIKDFLFPKKRVEPIQLTTEGRTYFVNPNNPNSDDANSGLDPNYPLRSIGQAYAYCAPGDRIIQFT